MIEFESVTQVKSETDAIFILAEAKYDESILGSESPWYTLSCLAIPVESELDFNEASNVSAVEYTNAIENSKAAMTALQTLVELSNLGKVIVIGCYAYNVKNSHLPILLDLIEDLFVEQAPELRLIGG